MYIAGDLRTETSYTDMTTTATTIKAFDRMNLFGAAAQARVCYGAAASWAFRTAPPPPPPLITSTSTSTIPGTPRVRSKQRGLCSLAYASPPPRHVLNFVSVTGVLSMRVCEANSLDFGAKVATLGKTSADSSSTVSVTPAAEEDSSSAGASGPESEAAPTVILRPGILLTKPKSRWFETGRLPVPCSNPGISMEGYRYAALRRVRLFEPIGESDQADAFHYAMKRGEAGYSINGYTDQMIRRKAAEKWQSTLMTKEGRRFFSRVWHSVTPDNLEDFDILRDAKPERVSKEALARGKSRFPSCQLRSMQRWASSLGVAELVSRVSVGLPCGGNFRSWPDQSTKVIWLAAANVNGSDTATTTTTTTAIIQPTQFNKYFSCGPDVAITDCFRMMLAYIVLNVD
ncbi:hypothetical protein MIR68_006591 [Amoeboaphelidium protococcarum]|nr:hypothetical protein MIR68_006591 [Amoeboaphelidium protococcarum]